MRQVQAVAVLRPAAHEYADGCARARQGHQHGARGPLGQHRFGDGADSAGDAGGRGVQRGVEQLLIAVVGLVLDGQRFRVVRAAALDGLLAFLRGGLQFDAGEVLEEPADLVGGVGGERGAAQGSGSMLVLLSVAAPGAVDGPYGGTCGGAGGTAGGCTEAAAGGVAGEGVDDGTYDGAYDGTVARTTWGTWATSCASRPLPGACRAGVSAVESTTTATASKPPPATL